MLLAGCGGSGAQLRVHPQLARVDWTESGDPHTLLGGPIVYHVRTIRIRPSGWTVDASVTNRTKRPLRIVYAHEPAGHNAFGILAGDPRVAPVAVATHFHPPAPTLLRPGESWSGTFSGPDPLAPGTYVHVQFGQFATLHADRFAWVTDHAYRVH